MALQGTVACYGLHIENNIFRAEFTTSYSKKANDMRFNAGMAKPEKPVKFMHARLGFTGIQFGGVSKTKTSKQWVGRENLGGGWWKVELVDVESKFRDGLMLEPGLDYYQFFTTTEKATEKVYAKNGQFLGEYFGTNMKVFSAYARLCFNRELSVGVIRVYAEYVQGLNISLENVIVNNQSLQVEGGGNSGFEYKKFGIKLGTELYLFNAVSTRLVVGQAPGIKGRSGFSTILSIGIPIVLNN